jgi:nicotinamide-nucleotide amidase
VNIELVTIGTELLLGQTLDTNGAELGRGLADAGIRVVRRTAVPDAVEPIASAVASALARTGAVLTTGGLGPTRDDVSKRAVADLLKAPLRFDEAVWEDLASRFRRLGREPSPANRCQAEVPEGAAVLRNRWGTAPGLWIESTAGLVIMLPGVPGEMRKLLEQEVLPRLRPRAGAGTIRSLVVRTTSIPESTLGERIGPLEEALRPLTLAYLPGLHGVDLRLTAWDLPAVEADRHLEAAARRLEQELGDSAYGVGDDDLAAMLLDRLRAGGHTLALAESCTGGLIGVRITDVPGSSTVFLGGVVSYADQAKADVLGVSPDLIAAHGAVSVEVARAMASEAARRFGATAGIGITGVAGPGGGSAEKPVGTVCFGWKLGGQVEGLRAAFPGSRGEVRERAVQFALHRLWRMARAVS